MSKAIRIREHGGPEVMQWVEVDVPAPGADEVQIRQEACGVNYIDLYHRTGLYPTPLPAGLGCEAAGVVEAVGTHVKNFKVGERVAYTSNNPGAYAQLRNVPAALLLHLPETVAFDVATASLLRGLTVQYLFRRIQKLKAGDTVLFHAAAGGVGQVACQWARALGVNLIATVGSPEKAATVRALGCTHVIDYRREDFVARVREITDGQGVSVVYDSVGKDTFSGSLDCLSPLGMMVSFGNASGPVPPMALTELSKRRSLFFTRPALFDYIARRSDLEAMAQEWFAQLASGAIQINISARHPLADAAKAHRALESRNTQGSLVLTT